MSKQTFKTEERRKLGKLNSIPVVNEHRHKSQSSSINDTIARASIVYISGSQPGVSKPPGVHGKTSRGTCMTVKFPCIAIF